MVKFFACKWAFYFKKKLNIFLSPDDFPLTDMVGVGFSTKIP
jgi:hypothetical protein